MKGHLNNHPLFEEITLESLVCRSLSDIRILLFYVIKISSNIVLIYIKLIFYFLTLQSNDIILKFLGDCTEEGQKVTRNNGQKFTAIFRRVDTATSE